MSRLRAKLRTFAIVVHADVTCSTSLLGAVSDTVRRHIQGEPLLPRKFVLAVLLVRKLHRGLYWAGNAKGYLWGSDLAKGRGVDEQYRDIVQEVTNLLLMNGILTFKTSKGSKKYALNPDNKREVYKILEEEQFPQNVERSLFRDDQFVSVGELLARPVHVEAKRSVPPVDLGTKT